MSTEIQETTAKITDLVAFGQAEIAVNNTVAALLAITMIDSQEGADSAMEELKKAKSVENTIEARRKELVSPHNDTVKRINAFAKDLIAKLPPAIEATKKAILSFQQEELRKAKELRTKNREEQLISLGYTHFPQGDESVKGNIYRHGDALYLTMSSITEDEDSIWNSRVQKAVEDIQRLKDEALKAKEAELEELDFFGTEEEKEKAKEDIAAIQSQPVARWAPPVAVAQPTKPKGLTKRWVFEITNSDIVPRGYLTVDEKKIREAVATGIRDIAGIRIYQEESISIR